MHITTLLNDQTVMLGLDVASRGDAIRAMIDRIANHAGILDAEIVREAVLEREGLATTGIGEGIAIPHAKTDQVSDVVGAVALLKRPIDFMAIDGEPVRIIFLLVGLESRVGTYLKLLSRVRRLMGNPEFRGRLLEAKGTDDVIEAFHAEEDNYFHIPH